MDSRLLFRWQKPMARWLPTWLRNIPFILIHLACLAVFFTGITTTALILCGFCYFLRVFALTAGFHRYFAHRAYKTSRAFQFVLAWLGCSALQKGPLWWAAHHRDHHKYSDTEKDLHSPHSSSFWWSHVGWVMANRYDETNWQAIKDFARYPELRWLNAFHWLPGIVLAAFCFLVGGWGHVPAALWTGAPVDMSFSFPGAWSSLVVGFFISTVLVYHVTFFVNSLCHILGSRRYKTDDHSRNNWWVALLTFGEGWHNNHHHYQRSANQGFFWWEIDISYYLIQLLALCGVVWEVRKPPRHKIKVKARSKKTQLAQGGPFAVPLT